jgi:hypothetical protein
MTNRYFLGTPNTDTDINEFEKALRDRAEEVAAGKFAAATAAEHALEVVSRRSIGLLQFNALLATVLILLAYKVGTSAPALFLQFNRWGFGFLLVGILLLLPNLAIAWAGNPGQTYRDAQQTYRFSMNILKVRAARYTGALVLTFVAAVLTALSIMQI